MFFKVSSELPSINSFDEFSNAISLSKETLYRLWKWNNKHYKEVEIPKKSGGIRLLACPSKKMKAVQGWILKNILEKIIISENATAYIKNQSILMNAIPHRGKKYILAMDVENYFPSIRYAWVFTIFKKLNYPSNVCHMLTKLTTYKYRLPQGGVTSPAISNVVSYRLDRRLSSYAQKLNVSYTRYADDITYSSNVLNHFNKLKKFTKKVLREEGFEVNEAKTRILGSKQRRKITGLVLDKGEIRIGKYKKNELRVLIHKIFTSPDIKEVERMKSCLEGWFSYLKSVDLVSYQQLMRHYNHSKIKYMKSPN